MAITGITYQSQANLNAGNTTPHGVTHIPSPSAVWIANNSDDSIYKYSAAAAYQSKAGLPAGNTQPRGLCWVSTRSEVWSLDQAGLKHYRIHPTTGVSPGSYNLNASNTHAEGVLHFVSIDEVWVADRADRAFYRYRASDGTYLGTYALDSGNTDVRGACHVDSEAWVLNASDKKLYRYSATGAYLGTYDLAAAQQTPRAITRVGSQLWCVDNGSDTIFRYTLQQTNRAPTAVGTIATQTVRSDQTGRVALGSYFSDADGDTLTYTASSSDTAKATVSVAGATLTIRGVAIGTATITVTASDGSLTATQRFTVTLTPARTVRIEPGYRSRYVQAIGDEDPADLNDFQVLLDWNAAVSDFGVSRMTVTGASGHSFSAISETKYLLTVRPPASGSGTITITVAANAVSQGNLRTTASVPYTDSIAGALLFDWNTAIPNIQQGDVGGQYHGPKIGFVVEGSRIRVLTRLSSVENYANKIFSLLHNGTRVAAEDVEVAATVNIAPGYLRVVLNRVNHLWFASVHAQLNTLTRPDIYRTYWTPVGSEGVWQTFAAPQFGIRSSDFGLAGQTGQRNAAHSADINQWGLFFPSRYNNRVFARNFAGQQQNIAGVITGGPLIASGERLYRSGSVYRAIGKSGAVAVPDEALRRFSPSIAQYSDSVVYGKWFYYTSGTKLYRVDLEPYRVPAVRARILPQRVKSGESLPLKPFVSGAENITFERDYAVPSYLSIDSNLNLVIAHDAITEDVAQRVKLRAFNSRYEAPFSFYLIVEKKRGPQWKAIKTLPVDNGETVNLLDLVPNAVGVQWKSGFTAPSGYTLSNGQLTVQHQTSEAPVPVALTASNAEGSSDKTFSVITRVPEAIRSSDVYDFRVLIEGIDVSEDLLEVSGVHKSLDVINPNEFVSDDASFTLSSDRGKYDGRVAGNFWDQQQLNKNGYLSEIELWVDILDSGVPQSKLLFEGLIIEVHSSLNDVSVVVNCVDRTYRIKNTPVASVGLAKFSELHRVRETYEGVYAPDAALRPVLREGASVLAGTEPVPIQTYTNAPEAVAGEFTGYVTADGLRTRGGYLPEDPLLQFVTPYQRRHIDVLIKAISEASGFFNPKVALNRATPAAQKHIASRGNVAFNVEPTKPSRTVVDWLHDATHNVFYQLLSHPAAYIQDILVAYDPETDTYTPLKRFAAGVQVVQLASADFDTFYILATEANNFDRIKSPVPPNHDGSVFDNLDSSRETGVTRILKYVVSTETETPHVDGDDAYPPQIGLHYMAGFENERHIRWREGIFAEARSTFRVHNNQLYYRFAKWGTFGVARATASGTTTALVTVNCDVYFNALNFGFDIASNGDVYMVYAEGTHTESSLKVERYDESAGSVSTVYALTDTLTDLTAIDSAGGAWLGCHEVKLFRDRLYCVLPIQRVTGSEVKQRDIQKSAGAVLAVIHPFSRHKDILERYPYVQLSCRSLTVHANQLYFAEYPNASTHFAPSNPDLDGWDPDTRQNTVPQHKVWLRRVVSETELAAIVSPWYAAQPLSATAVPMLSDGDTLHALVRYADKFEISAVDADAASPENEQWVTFGADIPFFAEGLPSGSLHDALVAFAKLGNARLQIVANRFRFVDVDPSEALLSTGLSATASQLNYRDANKPFPGSGYVLIGAEVIAYTHRTPARLSGLTRGVGGTDAAAHTAGARVLFLDKVIEASAIDDPYQDIHIRIDTNNFYNVIEDSDQTAVASDAESVARYGARAYRAGLLLSDHQIPWRRFIHAKTLNRLKDIKSVIRVRMRAAYYLDIGDVVYFHYAAAIAMPVRIMDIRHTQTETHLIGQEIKPLPRIRFGNATIADQTATQYTAITPLTLPAAESPKPSYVYRVEGLSTGLQFDPDTRQVWGTPIDVHAATPIQYIVTDADNPTGSDALTFDLTVTPAPLAWVGAAVSDRTVDLETAIDIVLPYARGGTGQITYSVSSLDSDFSFDQTTRRLTGTKTTAGLVTFTYSATDAAGTAVTRSFAIRFLDVDAITFRNLRIASATGTFTQVLTEPSALAGLTYTMTVSGLPTGWTFTAATRTLSGNIASAPNDWRLRYEIVIGDLTVTGTFDVFKFYYLNNNRFAKAFAAGTVTYVTSLGYKSGGTDLATWRWNYTSNTNLPIKQTWKRSQGYGDATLSASGNNFSVSPSPTNSTNYYRHRATYKGRTIYQQGVYA